MLLSVVDVLRCPRPHEESSLVLSVETWNDQRILRGTLGCPICHCRFSIENGVTDFREGKGALRTVRDGGEVDTLRLAAQLALTDPGGFVLLTGTYASVADSFTDLAGVTCIVIDWQVPDESIAVEVIVSDRLPLAAGTLRAAAVDAPHASPGFLAAVAASIRDDGRIVGPAAAALPPSVEELARDDREWVGRVRKDGTPIRLLSRRDRR
ncbi:MAG TPA: hypothetical protein VFZ73_01785 [Gemmatimonadaceae bacterium]